MTALVWVGLELASVEVNMLTIGVFAQYGSDDNECCRAV